MSQYTLHKDPQAGTGIVPVCPVYADVGFESLEDFMGNQF
jgi:hypothetical protein